MSSIYYTKYSDSVVLFKSFSSNQIIKIDPFGASLINPDNFDHYNYYFNTFRKNINHCLGIIGVITLNTIKYAIVATGASVQTSLLGNHIYKLGKCEFIPLKLDNNNNGIDNDDDKQYLNLLKYHLSTGNLIYCSNFDLSRNFQSIFTTSNKNNNKFLNNLMNSTKENMNQEILEDFSSDFFWNEYSLKELISVKGSDEFLIPLIYGYSGFTKLQPAEFDSSKDFYFGVISRRNKNRAGTRYFKRGVDNDGNVGNFNETEQILLIKEGDSLKVKSFLQIRGSIPINWAEINNLKYKPKLLISKNSNLLNNSIKHFQKLSNNYSDLENIYIINLINSKGHELPVKNSFESIINEISSLNQQSLPELNYIYFDFHEECKKFKYDNIQKLISTLKIKNYRSNDYFQLFYNSKNLVINSTQKKLIRTNCMDCLDRTNVVQSVIGKWILFEQLNSSSFDFKSAENNSNIEELENGLKKPKLTIDLAINTIWTDNGDYISKAYSGTGALKSEFTKTGKRTMEGVVKDFFNSAIRYFKNNFNDGFRQDSFDLFLGNYKPNFFNEKIDYKKFDLNNNDIDLPTNINKEETNFTHEKATSISLNKNHTHNRHSIHNSNANYTPFPTIHQNYYPSNINMNSSPFYDCRPFKYQSMPYLLLSTTSLFFAIVFFPRGDRFKNYILLGTCLILINWSIWFIWTNGLQFINWPKLCDLEFLKKKKIIGEVFDNDDGVEGFEYIMAEEYNTELGKLD